MNYVGFDPTFNVYAAIFQLIFIIIFISIIVLFIAGVINSLKEWKTNNNSPILTINVVVIAKRGDISHNHYHSESSNHHTHSSTSYYVTFEVESGDRMEFNMPGSEYGLIMQGDTGKLTFQGTRYIKFERKRGSLYEQ